MSVELIDELEAGELSVEFEGAGAAGAARVGARALLAADRALDRVPDRRRRADRHGLRARPGRPGLHASTPAACRRRRYELIEQLRDRYPGIELELLAPDARAQCQRMVGRHGPNLFYRSGRAPPALLQRAQGPAADAAPRTRSTRGSPACAATSGRRRTDIRKIEIDHDHGAIVKLNPLAEWTEEEVWDYVRERDVPDHPLYDARLHVDRLRAVHARDRAGRGRPRRPLVVGDERARRSAASTARSRPAASSTSCTRCSARTTSERGRVCRARRRGRAGRGAGRARAWPRDAGYRGGSPSSSPRSTRARSTSEDAGDARGAARARPAERPHPRAVRAGRRAGRAAALPPAAARRRAGRERARGDGGARRARGPHARVDRAARGRSGRVRARRRGRRRRARRAARPAGRPRWRASASER